MKWIPGLSNHTARMRELNQGRAHFKWLAEHQQELDIIKKLAAKLIPVHPFRADRKSFLFTDASVDGLGMVLMQQDPSSDSLLFIFASSTGLKDSQ